jgi:hypothetical protein
MKLINPTDDELNAAFAEKVAGWKLNAAGPSAFGTNLNPYWEDEKGRSQFDGPWFAYSADAVLPWLEKLGSSWHCSHVKEEARGDYFEFYLGYIKDGKYPVFVVHESSFPRAAVIALLRAHGVEIEFTK